jgi:hypothetical protein
MPAVTKSAAATAHLTAVAARLHLVNHQITHAEGQLDSLTKALSGNETTDEGQENEQRDVTILRSLPASEGASSPRCSQKHPMPCNAEIIMRCDVCPASPRSPNDPAKPGSF